MNFIKTQDEETALKLKALGFQELKKEGSFFVFINNGKQNFANNKNIVYTNKLNV